MFRRKNNCKRSGSLSRFLSVFLVGTTLLFSLGLPLSAEAQEAQHLGSAAATETTSILVLHDSDPLGSDLRAIVAKMHYRPLRAPQDSGGAPPHRHNHVGLLALAGIGMIAFGVWGIVSGYGQSCKTQKDIYGNTNTCGEDKAYGALFIAGGGAILAAAGYESASNSSATAKVKKSKAESLPPQVGTTSSAVPTTSSQEQEAQAAINAIQNVPHTEAPPVQAVGRGFGGSPSITIQNNTAYVLTVYLAGPTGVVMTLLPQGSRIATLVPGLYRIGGRVSDPSVEPFLGMASFQGGYQYQETFYISAQP